MPAWKVVTQNQEELAEEAGSKCRLPTANWNP